MSGSSPRLRSASSSTLQSALRATLIPIALFSSVAALPYASGCTRAVLVPESSPIRIGPATRARIYAMTDGGWELSANCVEIPEGWYCVPPSFVEAK